MTTETLTLLAGTLLSLGFSYVPGLSDWYARLGETPDGEGDGGTRKRLVMLALLVCSAAGAFALACRGWGASAGLPVACDQAGAVGLLKVLALAIVANQSVYRISPRVGAAARLENDRKLAALRAGRR